MKYLSKRVALFSAFPLSVMVALLSLWVADSGRRPEPVSTSGWTLQDFADHLRDGGLPLHVISSSTNNPRQCRTIYLTSSASACWVDMQRKTPHSELIADWEGTVSVSYFDSMGDVMAEPDTGDCCFRIDNFVVFGDPRLVARIREVLRLSDGAH
jgi:hypothetical protein